jgi:PAS domain S-box-containing protein
MSEGAISLGPENNMTKEFLENLLDSMEGGILAVDRNMKVTAFNRAAEEITGLKREEVLNKECDQVLNGDLCKG